MSITVNLRENWKIQKSSIISSSEDEISKPNFDVSNWYPAVIPTTVLNTLVKNDVYTDIYFGKNLEKIPQDQFKSSWWYRTEFVVDNDLKNVFSKLSFYGVNYRANIWLNGNLISSSDAIYGGFRIFEVNTSSILKNGINILAVEIFPPKAGEPSIGFVDWNPTPPDNNMGIWREVKLHLFGAVSVNETFVIPNVNINTLNEAELEIRTTLENHTDESVVTTIQSCINDILIVKDVSLTAGEKKEITFTPDEYPQLHIKNPKLWWPHNFGEANLYNLKLDAKVCENITDEQEVTFGIRGIEEYYTGAGHKGYKINGKKIMIKGAGWVDDLLLGDDYDKVEAQVLYAKHMNLNCIRLEGFWGSDKTLYDLCDREGILIMPGWSCHWEWQEYSCFPEKEDDKYGCITSKHDIELVANYMKDHIIWLRNHPSIFMWGGGSDKLPHPELERKYLEIFAEFDPTRGYISSHMEHTSEVTGPSAIKMRGPYDYVPPIYWYEDKSNGGAFGFNSETGPGPQPPMVESIKKMIPEENLWPIDDMWNYHCGRHQFNDMDNYIEALENRYGKPANLEEFNWKAQLTNYEAIRPMFESFLANKFEATGIIQWMLNSSWPETYWQLFDYYLLPTAAFYGTKRAAADLNLIYDYHQNKIVFINDTLLEIVNFTAVIKIFDKNSHEFLNKKIKVSVKENTSLEIFELPKMVGLSNFHFLSLKIFNEKYNLVNDNFYWLSKKTDKLDYTKVTWYITPTTDENADFRDLNSLPNAELKHEISMNIDAGKWNVTVELTNCSQKISFFNYLNIIDKNTGETVRPIYWDDNFVSVLPGDNKTIKAWFFDKNYKEEDLVFSLDGYNLKK